MLKDDIVVLVNNKDEATFSPALSVIAPHY